MFGLSTPLERQIGCLSETQTGCLDTAQNSLLFMFGGNNWNQSADVAFGYNLVFLSASETFGVGDQTFFENYCVITSFTRYQWNIACYCQLDLGTFQWRTDGDGDLIPYFQGAYSGFCQYPQQMNDYYNNVGGIGLMPPKFTNGCSVTLNAQGTVGIITKHSIVSTTGGSTPIMLAPAAPLDIIYVNLTTTGLVTYTCTDSQAIIFWIGLTEADIAAHVLPSVNFDPQTKGLLAFVYPT
jgi:hypothetical protein